MFLVQAPNLSKKLVGNQVHSTVGWRLRTTEKIVSSLIARKDLARSRKIEAFEIDLYLDVHFHFFVTSGVANHQKQ
jgi:hypothetical protein